MAKPKYTIAVTGLNAIDSPGPGIAVIKALRDAKSFDCRVIGLSYETLEPGIYRKDLVDKTYQIPLPSTGKNVLLDRLAYINSIENVDFLFPNFDAELFNFIKLEPELLNLGVKMCLPTLEQFESRHKVRLFEFGEENDLLVPRAEMVYTTSQIGQALEKFSFPVAVKGKFYDSKIAYTHDQAVQNFSKIAAEWGTPILIQEFIHGSEVNLCGIGDGKGNLLGAVPMRKLYVTDKGKAWAGVSIADKKLLDLAKTMVKNTGWKGPFEMEFMKTQDDEYYLLEINPRFPAWCYLTVGCGQNQIEALINLEMGEEVKPFEHYDVGKLFIRFSEDMVVDMKAFEQISTTGEY